MVFHGKLDGEAARVRSCSVRAAVAWSQAGLLLGQQAGECWDSMSKRNPSSSRVLQRAIVGLAVVALAIGGLRWVSFAAGLGLFEFLQPSMEDILDGHTVNPQRLAAVRTVDTWMGQAATPGATLAGTQTFTRCEWGQNNPEVKDGYRLRCRASGVLVTSWRGSFDGFAQAVGSGLDVACPGAGPWRAPAAPGALGYSDTLYYECSSGLELMLTFGDSGRVPSDGLANGVLPCDADNFRCISGKSTAQLRQAVAGSDFYAIQQVEKIYYEDQLW